MAKDGIRVHIYGDYDNKDIDKAIRDLQGLKKDAGQAEQKFGLMSKGMKVAGAAIAAAAAAAAYGVVKFAGDSIRAASDLDESMSKTRQVFGDASLSVEQFAKDAATNLGLSEQAALEATSTFGNLFRAMGINAGKASSLSQEVVTLAADLASFNNIDIQEAIAALRSGLVGETEPLRRLGVNLSAARIETEAFALGLAKSKNELDAGAKAQAAWSLITKDSSLAAGDFARTSDGLANTQRILAASIEDAKATIGTSLLEAIQEVSTAIGGPDGLNKLISETARGFGDIIEIVPAVARAFGRTADATDDASDNLIKYNDQMVNAEDVSNETARKIVGLIPVVGAYATAWLTAAESNNIVEQAALDNENAQAALEAGYAANAAKAREMAAANIQVAKSAVAAAKGTIEAAIATGQVPAKAAWGQRFDVAAMLDGIGSSARSAGSSVGSAGSAVSDLSNRIESARKTAVEGIKAMRAELRDQLEASRQEFNDYASSVSQSIRGAINFSDAAPEFDEQGNRVGLTFIEALQAQATKAQEFATKVKTLIAMGLSQEALQQVLAAGVQAGTNIANELITGGATTIEQTNELVATTQAAADEVGLQAATNFYGAGVETAQKTYEGFKANFGSGGPARKALMGVMDRLAAAAARQVRIDVAVTRNINEVVTRVVQTINAPVEPRALGGPVTAGSPYLIGERGPELFVPDISGTVVSNADLKGGGGTPLGGGVVINVNAGMGTDGAEVGRQIVDALKAYSRRNGPLPLAVS